ncbi:uncharacterized protein VP01_323g2 [Puccinia sorghi]|uniref:Uncharacterized protein n=1 Tax=Puccinia sorghi TaxID=27349 RepID=A0A0L6UZZ8_9BASI|nr:uncharacterized protein VP01_323g2 [Puccinia sorghi]
MWSFAYRCAIWISNRIPNTRTKSLTLLKIWSGNDRLSQQLYPFGIKAPIHIMIFSNSDEHLKILRQNLEKCLLV